MNHNMHKFTYLDIKSHDPWPTLRSVCEYRVYNCFYKDKTEPHATCCVSAVIYIIRLWLLHICQTVVVYFLKLKY